MQEYEDAAWPPRSGCVATPLFRAAVADGATETSFAALWARLLVRAYCKGRLRSSQRGIQSLRPLWLRSVADRPLPWYAEEKVRQGAFSTLLGLTLSEHGWEASAAGDSCLFHVRGEACLTAFPLRQSNEFSNRPVLLSSRPHGSGTDTIQGEGTWEGGDNFFLLTDALAAWALGQAEGGRPPWETLGRLVQCPEGFAAFVAEERCADRMRNDDVTLLLLRVE